MFSSKALISFRLKKDVDILDDMGVSKLSAKDFNYLVCEYIFSIISLQCHMILQKSF